MIYFITGGARSGKSSHAMKLAKQLSPNPIYLATARHWNGDFLQRIERHKSERDESWISLEEEKNLSKHDFTGKVVVIDCVTLWLTNFFIDLKNDINQSLSEVKVEIEKLIHQQATFIIISNEIGMGVHAETEIGRKFTDLQGWTNQYIAQEAQQVVFMVSGIPLIIKSPKVL
jgi:adenosylcobinamide kinase / adenosylcobinamide-phosphate guanylyltransferase